MKIRILTVLIGLLLSNLSLSAKAYLVSVGIADYPGKENDLRISDTDAQTIANIYQKSGADISLLTNEDAKQSAILSAMHTTFLNAETDDTVILFFSGHGMPGELVCYDGCLPYENILAMFKGCAATKKIVIIDACYSGKMRTSKQKSQKHDNQDVMFFLSSRTNEKSQESKFKNSLFTIFLERGLRGGADNNRDRIITARELYDFVHDGVTEASGGKQHPVMWGNFDNDMTVIKW